MGYVDIENITKEQSDIAMDEFARNPTSHLLYNGESMSAFITEFMDRTDGDNVINATGELV